MPIFLLVFCKTHFKHIACIFVLYLFSCSVSSDEKTSSQKTKKTPAEKSTRLRVSLVAPLVFNARPVFSVSAQCSLVSFSAPSFLFFDHLCLLLNLQENKYNTNHGGIHIFFYYGISIGC